MKQAAAALLLLVLGFGCASSDDDPMNEPRTGGRRGGWGGGPGRDGGFDAPQQWQRAEADENLPEGWWHDPQVSAAVNLTSGQYQSLQDLAAHVAADHERLTTEAANAQRDFRLMLDAETPMERDLEAAAKRVREARDRLAAAQQEYLVEQRLVLSHDQWQALQNAIREQRRNRMDRDRGDRGGYGGGMGGRRPGGMGGRRPY